jgi:hypothetical protein
MPTRRNVADMILLNGKVTTGITDAPQHAEQI